MNNTSDHHPIKMKILYGISNDADCKNLTKDCTNRAVKWDKVDIDLYVAITNEQSDSILNMPLETLEQATSVLEQVHGFLNDAAATCAANKPRYNAKPKLNVWSPDIKLALDEMRKYYAQWVKQGKIKDPENNIYQQRLRTKKEFRRQVRIENAKVKDTEKQRIMETRTKDTKLFHQLVKINRKNRGNAIMDLHVGDICMSGEQNVMEGFKQHFRNLATPEESTVLENRQYHQQVEYEIVLITEMVKDKNIPPAH
ncbi:TEAD [Mytilus edulis]|uniref:TEAD n=1 Tax=Mytilus edulis TaxID=6550 RepID=A0A8S3UFZ0_MYTED|nr:TEAD [Mytilus edulis]